MFYDRTLNGGMPKNDAEKWSKLDFLIFKNWMRDCFQWYLSRAKLSSSQAQSGLPLGVEFKYSDEHPRPFRMGVFPLGVTSVCDLWV